MSKKATIIAVVNQKGGTGKTTTTENLGVGLALEGKKVLLVDTDPQASLTVSLGNPCPDDLSPTLSDLMGKIMMENPITPDEGILHHPEGVDLVPSNIELSGMEVALVNAMSRETILRQYLDTENKKAELFSKVRSGQVRVLLGSTAKMGAGTNVQTLLVAVHHLDVGWRPSDMTQRNGRIIRQGNKNKQVYVYNYVTESTFDAYLYQTLENKQKFISQIMTSKSPMRSCDDIDEQALSYAEIKALCAGDPRIREKMDLDVQVAKLKVLRGDFQNQKYRLEDKLLKTFPEEIQKQKTRIAALQQDSQIAAAHPQDKENFCGMTIKGMVYDDKKAAGERLLLARQEMPNADMMLLGTYRGFELNIRFDSFKNEHQAVLRAELSYPVSLGDDARGNITRLDNAIDNFADRIADAENALQNLEQQKQAAEVEVAKPFAQEEELAEKSARLAELNALLNIDRDRSSSQDAPEETEETETPATRPSVLAALGEKTNQPEPVRPFRSYYDKDGDAR